MRLCAAAAALAVALCAAWPGLSHASSRYCDQPAPLSAAQQDRLLRTSALLEEALNASGRRVAIIARSGLNLRWFGQRYSHAGISVQSSAASPWAVRQLYFACDEQAPRLFDQGLPAFVLGTEDPSLGFISVLLLPEAQAAAVEAIARDNRRSLSLLGADYSANAYIYSVRYQNCNQWLAELLGLAWGVSEGVDDGAQPRTDAQAWLQAQGFEGTLFKVPARPFFSLTAFSPYLHLDDHPEYELAQAQLRVSMPESIEAFVRRQVPGVTRVELCHTDAYVVVRQGWMAIADGCVAEVGDLVVSLR